MRMTQKGYVQNLALDQAGAMDFTVVHPFQFWFRPEPIKKQISVNYDKMAPIGMSHSYHVYSSTDNISVTFELFVNRLMLLKEGAVSSTREQRQKAESRTGNAEGSVDQLAALTEQMEAGLRYLEALSVPPDIGYGIVGGSPPPCILCFPGILTFRARLMSLETDFTECDIYGSISEIRAKCTFEEAPLRRYTMQDVLARGSNRA